MIQDLRFAIRQLRKAPGFAAVVILTLALGIGANTAIFSVVQSLLLAPLPYPESTRLAQVWHCPQPGSRGIADGGTFLDWKRHASCFESLAAVHGTSLNLSGVDEPAQLEGYAVSSDYLRVLRVAPVLGRGFSEADDMAGGDNDVVVISHELWQRRLAGDPSVVGKPLRLDGRSFTIIGVLPSKALDGVGGANIEFLVPAAIEAAGWKQQRNYNYVCFVIGRLKPGATFLQAQTELDAANKSLRSLYPPNKADWTVMVESLQSANSSGARPYLLMLMSTVALVLLIACANVANLLLARAASRQSEISVRMALGASAGRIVRLLLVESVLLALMGGLAGLLLAIFGLGPLIRFSAGSLISDIRIGLDPAVLLFTLCVSVVTGVVFGLVPALRIARTDLSGDLKDGSRGALGGKRNRLQRSFIVAETGLTVVLLFTAGLLLRSFVATMQADAGFRRDSLLLFDVNRDSASAPTVDHRLRFAEATLDALRRQSTVAAAGTISSAPLNNQRFYGDTVRKSEDRDPRSDVRVGFDAVSGDLFQTLGVPLLRGRFLTENDNRTDSARTLLANRALANLVFGTEDVIGRHLRFKDQDWEIVGLVGDVSRVQLDAPPPPMVYLPLVHFPWSMTFVVQTHGSPLAAASAVRAALRSVDPGQPLADLRTMQQAIDNSFSLRIRRMMLTLVGLFAGIALVLACVGLYGVMSYSIAQKTREIGVRIALGADTKRVLVEALRGGFLLVGAGLLTGACGSVLAALGVDSQVYGLQTGERGLVFFAVALVLLLVALLACWIPARRATLVDPVVALRSE